MTPDGRHFVSRARDEASSWRSIYKAPIPTSALANRLGSYVQAFTLYSSVRPFGVTAIVGGWDSEAELAVDGQVGSGPKSGAGGKVPGAKTGGPGLYMIEPSGLYWVHSPFAFLYLFDLFIRYMLTLPTGLLWCRHREGTASCQSRTRETRPEFRRSRYLRWR